MRITDRFIYNEYYILYMSRTKSFDPRKPFAVRLPQSVINDSKSIPLFRKRLEDTAVSIHQEWKRKELLLNG